MAFYVVDFARIWKVPKIVGMKTDFMILKHFECDFNECFVYNHIKCYVFQ